MIVEIGGLYFEWDIDKEQINIERHDVDFETAALIFLDDNVLQRFDDIHSDGEIRMQAIGATDESQVLILTAAYTERGENIRIINARKATKKERGLYYGQNRKNKR